MKLLKHFKLLLVVTFSTALLSSCTGFGNKVTFPDTKGEVYYKGDSVTETDAKNVGNFLKDEQYFSNDDKGRSVQITKDNGRIKARFVVDKKAIDSLPDADSDFAIIGASMSKKVFNSQPVDVIYTDTYFKDFKTIPFDANALHSINKIDELQNMHHKNYENNLLYYSNDVADAEADSISAYLVQSGFFGKDGNLEIIAYKNNDGYLLKIPIKSSFNNSDGLQKIDDYGKEIKKNLFPETPFQFEVVDNKLDSIKTFSY